MVGSGADKMTTENAATVDFRVAGDTFTRIVDAVAVVTEAEHINAAAIGRDMAAPLENPIIAQPQQILQEPSVIPTATIADVLNLLPPYGERPTAATVGEYVTSAIAATTTATTAIIVGQLDSADHTKYGPRRQ